MWLGRSFLLFAQDPPVRREMTVWDLWLAVGALVGVVALGIWAIYQVKRWREESAEDTVVTPNQQLDHFQQMVDAGLLDPQEFARIKARMESGADATSPKPAEKTPPSNQSPDTSIPEK